MERHYDPRYDKHRARAGSDNEVVVETASLSPDALGPLADRVGEAVARLGRTGRG